MPIYSDNAPRMKIYASSHQTLTLHGSGSGNKVMQYNSVAFNNAPSGHFNYGTYNGHTYSLYAAQNGQYLIESSILSDRTTNGGYIHTYMTSYDSSGTQVMSDLVNHGLDAGAPATGWRHKVDSWVCSIPAGGHVQIKYYMYANVCTTYMSHSGASYCWAQITHLS